MSIYADLSNIDYDVTAQPQGETGTYLDNFDAKKVLQDPRFLKDLRQYYLEKEGYVIDDDEKLIDRFYEDGSWRDLNTVGAVGGALEAYGSNKTDRERMKRIEQVWRQLPMFWQDGGRGAASAVPDIAKAIIADPLNLIPGVAAYKAGATAGRAAYVAGKSAPMLRGALSGTGKAAVVEGGISAGQEFVVNTATQLRDKQLGLRDKFSAGELAASTALGGVLGGGVGGAIGAVPATLGAARGIEAPEMLNRMGVTREDLAAMSPEDQDAFAANLRRSGASGLLPPTQDAPAPDAEVAAEPMNPVEAMKAKLETTTSLARDELNSLRRTGADEETVANATKYVSDLARLREGIARIEREAEQIRVLEGSSDPQDIARAAKMREGYETFLSDFSLLLDDIDAAGSPEEFIQTMRDRNFGGGGSETPPATPDAAPEAAPAGEQPPVTSEAAGDIIPPSPPSPEEVASAREAADAKPETTEAPEAPEAPEAATDAAPAVAPEVAETPQAPPINMENRGRALAAGLDWRNITPSEKSESGRITKGAVSKAIRGRADDAEPDAYASQVEDELGDILEQVDNPEDYTPEELLEIVEMMSRRDGVKTDADDISALFRHIMFDGKAPDTTARADAESAADAAVKAEQDRIDALAENGPEMTDAEYDAYLGEIRGDPEKHAALIEQDLLTLEPMLRDNFGDEADAMMKLVRDQKDLTIREKMLDEITNIVEEAETGVRLQEISADEFTTTELKRIRRLSKSKQKEMSISKEIADFLAERQVIAERGADTTAPKARKSQDAIDRAAIMETAGRSNNGKIQAFLKRSGRGGLDPQYQVRKSGLAKEEAIIRAQSGTGPSIVPYTTRTQEVVKGPEGDVTVKKGTTVFVDARTQRSYISKEYAEYVRGDRKGAKATAAPTSKAANKKTVTDALASGDPNALAAALRSVRELAERAAAKSDGTSATPEPALSPPVTKGGQKLIVQSKADPDVVRMISQRQINEGKDISAIIGQKAGEPESDPANWIVKYAPIDAKARGAALRRLFDSLPEEANQTGKGARLEAGDATGAGEPLTVEEFMSLEFTVSAEEAAAINTLAGSRGRKKTDGSLNFTGGELRRALLEAEGSRWPQNADAIDQLIEALKTGYQIQARIAPQGYIEEVATRAESIASVERIFSGRPAEELALMKRFMERLGGDRSVGPIVNESSRTNALRSDMNTDPAKRTRATDVIFAANEKGLVGYLPAQSTVQHEMAHWAYRYILTPQDRIDFWTSMQKYYRDNGSLDTPAIQDRLTIGGSLNVREDPAAVDPSTGERLAAVTLNDMHSPQEFFANQFDMWASQNAGLMVKDEALWKRVARYIKAVFDRYYDRKRIDPDLEPLFAKILPPEEEKVFGLGVHANPQTPEGKVLQSNFVQLQVAKMDLEEAIQNDSADGIISAAEAYRTLLLSIAKNDAETATGPLLAFRKGKRGKGAGKILKNRIKDIDEIINGKPVFDELGKDPFNPAAYEGLSLRADPQQVADDLTDFYFNGYNGRFEPKNGYYGNIKDWEATSLQRSFGIAERVLNGRYQEVEGTADLAAGRVPDSVKGESQPPRDGKGNVNPSKGKAKAKANIEKRDERTDAQATADANTTKGKRARADASKRPTVDVSTAPEVRSQSLTNLRKLYQKHKGTDYGDQVALEITRKIKAKPLPAKPVPITREIMELGKRELNAALLEAIHAGDAKAVKQLSYETQRRLAKRKAKREGQPLIKPTFQQIKSGIIREKLDSTGVSSSDGIPASARPSVREVLGRMTHREPEVQVAARTITYRLLNLMNRTHKGTMEEGNDILVSDVQRLVGFSPERSGNSIFVNTGNPEFKELQATVRRIASTVTRGQANPEARVIDLIQMIGRTSIPMNERAALVEFFNEIDPSIKRMTEDKYPLPDGIEDSVREEYLAISLISELTSDFMQGKMRIDAITERASGIVTASQINDVQRAMDRLAEYTSYVLNGHVGRPDLKETYPHLDFYGDMFTGGNRPMYGALEGEYLVHTSYAADFAHDTLSSMDKAKRARVDTYTKGGVGYDEIAEMPVVFYHGTPNGKALRKANNPGVIFEPSRDGQYGPGYYLTANPHVASNVYAEKATPDAMRKQVEAQNLSEDDEIILLADVHELFRTRKQIQMQRREYQDTALMIGSDSVEAHLLADEIAENVKLERNLVETLEDAGVVTDPEVLPMVISLKNPADFSETRTYEFDDPFVQRFLDEVLKNEDIGTEAFRYLESEMAMEGQVSGDMLYRMMSEALDESLRGSFNPRVALNQMLKDMGHDGMITDHRNTLTMGRTTEATEEPRLGAEEVRHKTMVLFDAEQAKHIDAEEFNASDLRMYQQEMEAIPKGTVGDLVDLIITNQINKVDEVPVGQLGEVLEQQGTNGTLTGALMSMVKGRNMTAGEEQAVRKRSYFTYFQSQSERMKSMGATFLADFYKNHFPDLNQRFASKFMPIMNALDELPDADGMLRAHFRASTAGVGQKQPASHRRIIRALRRGDGTAQERALSDAERAIYRQIRATLAQERAELNALGFHVGDRGPNYVPQVWDGKKIAKRRTEFLTKMIEYYKVDAAANGRVADNAEAEAFANGVMLKLTEEGDDGVFIPARGSTKNPTFENVDYSRVIELDKYPEMLDELEEFLESDISALLVKYLEGSSRRNVHAKKLGVNSHAVNDYLTVASDGEAGIAKLLSTNKVFKTDRNAMNPDGKMEVFTLEDTIAMPFTGNEAASREFSRNLIKVHNAQGTGAARKMLEDLYASGRLPVTYQRRVDAIIGALEDYKGQPNSLNTQDEVFIEQAMKVAMKKPMDGQGAKSVVNVSRALRMTNNVTLLGFTTLTSLGDVVLPIIRSGQFGSWAKGLGKTVTDPHYRRMLKNVGVAMENIVHERMIHMYGSPDNKASHAFFNATLLTPWTDMNRTIAGATGFESFAAMQAKAFDKFVPGKSYAQQPAAYKTAHRFLQRYGMQDFLPNGPKSGMSLSTRAVADDLMVNDDAVRMAIIKFADEAIFQPNPNDIPLWAQTPIGALVFQLKSFPLMMTRLTGHVLSEANNGNFKPLFYLSTLGPAFGMATLSAKDIIQQRGGDDGESAALRKRNIAKTLGHDEKVHGNVDDFLGWYVEGMMVMGGLGLFGDVIHSAVSQVDNGAYGQQRMWSTVLGPTFGLGNAAMQVAAGVTDANDNSNAKERSATREVATRIPILGGNRKFRESVVDAVAGEQGEKGGTGGWASGSWGSEWK